MVSTLVVGCQCQRVTHKEAGPGRAVGKGSDTVGWSHMLAEAPLAWRGQRKPVEAGTAVRRRHAQYFELLGGHASGERLMS